MKAPLDRFEDKPARTFERIAGLADCDVLVFGHSHKPWIHDYGDVRLVNSGSVGTPKDGDARAPPSPYSKGRARTSARRSSASPTTRSRSCAKCGP